MRNKMAKDKDDLSCIFTCIVCLEDYNDDADHVPRLLPCTHTLCEGCIRDLIQNNRLECIECGKRHEAKDGVESFPPNQYLLVVIRKRTIDSRDKGPGFEKCEKHRRDLALFCVEEMCQKPICISCLNANHKQHKVRKIEEQIKELFNKRVTKLMEDIHRREVMVYDIKKTVADKVDTCVEEIQKAKEYCVRHFDEIIEEVENESAETYMLANTELSTIRANMEFLSNIHENLNREDQIRYETIQKNHKLLKEFTENNTTNLSGTRSFHFPIFTMGGFSAELTKGEIPLQCDMALNASNGPSSLVLPDHEVPKPKRRKSMLLEWQSDIASEPKCTVTKTINMNTKIPRSITVLGGYTALICFDKAGTNGIKSYNLQTGTELGCVNLLPDSHGLAEVFMGGKLALAVAHRSGNAIEFRDAYDLSRILHVQAIAPHEPVMLSTTTAPSVLLYVDWSKTPFQVHWLDLSDAQPKPAAGRIPIHTQHSEIYDMCFAQDGDRQLLVVAVGQEGLFAYDIQTNRLAWKVGENLGSAGVTTDGRGHLFVADYDNQCIHLIRTSGSIYAKFWMKFPEALGHPARIHWSAQTSSLIAACWSNGKWLLNVINVQNYSEQERPRINITRHTDHAPEPVIILD